MCGIVGYVGREHRAVDVLVEGLRRLEYRGYDSAGVAIVEGGRLEVRCNWEPFALEFAASINHLLGVHVAPAEPPEQPVLSPFERKYRRSGHRLYSVVVVVDSGRVK